MDIFLLGYKVIKQLSLPNRTRKGNLLSSLFIFFIAIIERLNFFEHGIFSMAALFRNKYVKQTIFLVGFILFLLSLFEWTGNQRLSNKAEIASTERVNSGVSGKTAVQKAEALCRFSKPKTVNKQLKLYALSYNSFNIYCR